MADDESTCPMTRTEIIDAYFMEHRARLIDIAAWLDRLDRARDSVPIADVRETAFRQALELLTDGSSHRVRRILTLLSDHSADLPQSAHGMKGASGAPPTLPSGGTA